MPLLKKLKDMSSLESCMKFLNGVYIKDILKSIQLQSRFYRNIVNSNQI